eukprot:scaffold272586_cov40-Prasinocladus_malaysianus.AAC.1
MVEASKTDSAPQPAEAPPGLQPTDKFCCCAPGQCGLRLIVLILAVLQAAYGGCILLVSFFSTLWSLIVYAFTLQLFAIVLLAFSFIFELIIGAFYLTAGIFGIKATVNVDKVIGLSPEVVKDTQYFYKLNLLAFLVAVTLQLIIAIFQSCVLAYWFAILLQWIWFVVYVAIAGFVMYTIWSYNYWINA